MPGDKLLWLYDPNARPAKDMSKHDQQLIQLGWEACKKRKEEVVAKDMIPEEIEKKYIHRIMELELQLAKAQGVCPKCGDKKYILVNPCGYSDTAHFACCKDYPHSEEEKIKKPCPTCKGTGKHRLDRPDRICPHCGKELNNG